VLRSVLSKGNGCRQGFTQSPPTIQAWLTIIQNLHLLTQLTFRISRLRAQEVRSGAGRALLGYLWVHHRTAIKFQFADPPGVYAIFSLRCGVTKDPSWLAAVSHASDFRVRTKGASFTVPATSSESSQMVRFCRLWDYTTPTVGLNRHTRKSVSAKTLFASLARALHGQVVPRSSPSECRRTSKAILSEQCESLLVASSRPCVGAG